jgi:hypothetical protein
MGPAARKTRPAQGHQLGRGDRRWLVFTGKKGGAEVGYGRKGKGTTIMLMVDGEGTPLSAFTTAANVSEVNAIETLVDERLTARKPKRLLYDRLAPRDTRRARHRTDLPAPPKPHQTGHTRRSCAQTLQTPL